MSKAANTAKASIQINATELVLSTPSANADREILRVRWSDVGRVVAFKRDVLAYDLICCVVEGSHSIVELNEEMAGWDELMMALPRFLPGARKPEEWWSDVAQPPFATSLTRLFERR